MSIILGIYLKTLTETPTDFVNLLKAKYIFARNITDNLVSLDLLNTFTFV